MNENTKMVLVVDDDEEFLLFVRAALERDGCRVSGATSAAEARRLLAQNRFHLVVADLRLPGASGLDVLAEARRIDPLTVGIVVTGYGSVESALEVMLQRPSDYLL